MGIKNLHKLLKKWEGIIVEKKPNQYKGKKIAIDISILIYQIVIAIRNTGADLTNSRGEITSHLYGIFNKTISNFDLSKVKVSIGPYAQKCCYEVKEDLESKFSEHCLKVENKIYLDLSMEIKEFCQFNKIELEVSDICTVENEKYNSYRRDKTKNRQLSKVWI